MNANLEKVLRVLKHQGSAGTTSDAELARLAGLSRNTIIKNKTSIQTYLKTAPKPTQADCDSVDRKMVQTYLDEALRSTTDNKKHIANSLGAIAGYVLRQETNLIKNVRQTAKVIRIGQAFINLVAQIQARKSEDGKGTPIHSKNKDALYLLNETNKAGFVDQLFKRTSGYKTGAYSKRWKLTELAQTIVETTIDKAIPIIKEQSYGKVTLLPAHIPPFICIGESVTQPKSSLSVEQCSFLIHLNELSLLSIPSLIQILNLAEFSVYRGYLHIPLLNLADVDPSLGRTYNVFTRLRSAERKALGYTNYDISGGIQIISFGILYRYASDRYREADDLIAAFSMIFQYGWEPDYKRKLRKRIAKELNIGVDEVKKMLTAYANGSTKNVEGSPTLQQFQEESDLLRREVTSVVAQFAPQVLQAAINQSKHEFDESLDWKDTAFEGDDEARKKASVFFFIWTHFEKEIRDAMLSVVDDGIPLHDAIYSKQDVPLEVFEQAILDQTGFEVKISH